MPTYRDFSVTDWARLRRDWSAWWRGELDRPLVVLETRPVYHADNDPMHDDFLTQFPLEMPVEDVLDRIAPRVEQTHFYGDAYPRWWPNFGAGVMAAFLGARVEYSTGTTWFHERDDLPALADFHPQFDPDNAWWQRVQAITRAAVARWGDVLCIGFTDIGGTLDVLASLRGTNKLLLDLYDTPGEVERLARAINALWLRYYEELHALFSPPAHQLSAWAPVWFPARGYMLQCDFAYMISPEMFARFVLPDLRACCDHLDYGFYHLDGKGQIAHLDQLLALERLRGIQWVPGAGNPDPEGWPDLLRRIRDAGKLVQVFTSRAGALQLVRDLGGQGMVIAVSELDHVITPDEAAAFFEDLHALDIRIA